MPDPVIPAKAARPKAGWPLRAGIIAVVLALIGAAYAMGWHRQLSLETLVRHRAMIDGFVAVHFPAALAIFIAIYVATVSLSIPAALFLTIAGGVLFGPVAGPVASIAGSTTGAAIVFVLARTALGESLVRRAGPAAARLAEGFRADAFSYLLFLRLAPIFPFWLVNLAPALFGVRLTTFVAATVIGITPAAFAFGFVGAGLDSVIAAPAAAYHDCLAAGRPDCRLDFTLRDAVTPQMLAAFAALAVIALLPVVVKRWRARRRAGM
jgi:uncharacterized membrane protein YdjX (TVP38/TMEM64 family)